MRVGLFLITFVAIIPFQSHAYMMLKLGSDNKGCVDKVEVVESALAYAHNCLGVQLRLNMEGKMYDPNKDPKAFSYHCTEHDSKADFLKSHEGKKLTCGGLPVGVNLPKNNRLYRLMLVYGESRSCVNKVTAIPGSPKSTPGCFFEKLQFQKAGKMPEDNPGINGEKTSTFVCHDAATIGEYEQYLKTSGTWCTAEELKAPRYAPLKDGKFPSGSPTGTPTTTAPAAGV